MNIIKGGKERNPSVEGYRFLLILYVVLFHYTYRFDEIHGTLDTSYLFESGGLVGNCLFYVVSGFFLNRYLIRNSGGVKDYVVYVINKYWRLWPQYAVAVIIVFAVSRFFPLPDETVDWTSAIVNVFFVYHPKFEYVDGAHWFIANLFLFQLFMGVAILLRDDKKRLFIKLAAIYPLSVYLLQNWGVIEFCDYYYNLACPYFLSFYLGMVINDFVDQRLSVIDYVWLLFIVLFWIIVTGKIVFFVFLIFFVFLLYNKSRLVNILLGNRLLVYLGGVSFSWYLIHQNIGFTILYYLNSVFHNRTLLVLIALSSTFLMAIVLNALASLLPKKIVTKHNLSFK